jgi:HEAT repeat protein
MKRRVALRAENPTWGRRHIRAELALLGYAVYTAERLGETALAPDVRACLDDPDPLVRETALWAASRREETALGMDLRERVTRALGDPDRGVRRIAATLAAADRFPP